MSFWSDNPAIMSAAVGGLAGLIGGVVSAVSKGFVDEQIQTKRLRFERQQRLIDAQSTLLDDLTNVCWKWRYDATRLAYYGSGADEDAYKDALKSYRDNIWTNLNQIRFMGTRAGRLFSRSALDKIEEFYGHVDDVDQDIEHAVKETSLTKRRALFEKIYPVLRDKIRMEIADLILNLAKGVDLVPRK